MIFLCISGTYAFMNTTPPDEVEECSPLSFEMFLPEGITVEDVVSFKVVEMGAISNIYQIQMVDGSIFYEVLSSVTLEVLPYAAKTACIGVTKSPKACDYVYKAGATLIILFDKQIHERVKTFWSAKISGDRGLASLFTENIAEAREGQAAFEDSRNTTGYPWQTVDIVDYQNRNRVFGDH